METLKVPAGFKAAAGATAEPYTQTGWAKEIVHDQTGLVLVYVPAGEFVMGSPKDEAGRFNLRSLEEMQHPVTLTRSFYLGRHLVTQGQWEKVTGSNPSKFTNVGQDAPVESVSWDDCQAFCQKVGQGFRLPTEAEWEYACRAGTQTALNNGRNLTSVAGRCPNLGEVAWYWANSGGATHPVGQKKPNAWGLYDMHGNVYEWCQDWLDLHYPVGPVTDPTGPADPGSPVEGWYRVFRGGCWYYFARVCRSAFRLGGESDERADDVGLRLAFCPPPSPVTVSPADEVDDEGQWSVVGER